MGGGDSAELFGWLLRATADPMVVFRVRDGRVVDCNNAFLRLTGYARGELVGRAGADLGLEGLSRRDVRGNGQADGMRTLVLAR